MGEKIFRYILGSIFLIVGLYELWTAIIAPSNNKVSTEVAEEFSIISEEVTTDKYGNQYIEGIIKNNTEKDYSYVQVEFCLYDEDGNQIGTALDNINDLKAGATWKYKATPLTTEKFVRYEFSEIGGW